MVYLPFNSFSTDDIGFSKIFMDYISNFSSVAQFFNGDFREANDWKLGIDQLSKKKHDRSRLAQILLDQNRDFQCGVRTLANIDLLINDNTFAVVTGQQVGLFGGPLYTIYKSLTALKLAEKLSQQYPECNFVPIFWLETEDHDFEEVSSFSIYNASNDLIKLEYAPELRNANKNLGAIGHLPLTGDIEQVFRQLQASLLPTEFTPKVVELFHSAYQPGMTFGKAFVHLMNVLLENSGLIFLDPNHKDIKQLLAPIFLKELTGTSKSCQLVITQSEMLEHHYHAQVKPKSVNLFFHHKEGRFSIEPRTDGFFLKGTRQSFTNAELLALLDSSPELFSPNVVLRPICQDYLLPTVTYVAGPGEIAYFAQFKTLYENFNLHEPIIYPRASLTIVEERVQKVIEKFNLEIQDLFKERELVKERVTKQLSDFEVEALFTNTAGTIAESLNSLKGGLEKIDATLSASMENTLSKMLGNLNALKERTAAAQRRQYETTLRQLDKAADRVFPSSGLQERQINLVYFLNKYGLEFVRWLYNEIEIDRFKHQIVTI